MENVFLLYSEKKKQQIFKKKVVVIIIQFLSVVWKSSKRNIRSLSPKAVNSKT